jgi:hypothetical protein
MSMHKAIELHATLQVQSEEDILPLAKIQKIVLPKCGAVNFDGGSAVSTAAWHGNNLPI